MTEKINPSIVVLKSGEKLITILQEVFEGSDEDKKGLCLLFTHPYVLSLIAVENLENPMQDLQVKFSKWCPYSIDTQFRIPYDAVMAISQPDPGLATAYAAKVEQANELMQQSTNFELQKKEIQKVINPEVLPNE